MIDNINDFNDVKSCEELPFVEYKILKKKIIFKDFEFVIYGATIDGINIREKELLDELDKKFASVHLTNFEEYIRQKYNLPKGSNFEMPKSYGMDLIIGG